MLEWIDERFPCRKIAPDDSFARSTEFEKVLRSLAPLCFRGAEAIA